MQVATRETLMRQLAEQVETLRTSEGWQHWLNVAAKFRTYSLANQLLICAQRPEATHVAGYRTWQQLGRHVRKGEHGIRILAPLIRKIVDPDTADGSERRAVITGFKTVAVFDISQTDGADLPEPEMPPVNGAENGLLERLMHAARDAGITVETTGHRDNEVHGWYDRSTNTITLVNSYSYDEQARTLLHELAHAHDTVREGDERAIRELVAESAAYLVGVGHFNLAMQDASAFYVMTWGADHDKLEELACRVRNVAEAVENLVRTNDDVRA